MADDKSTARCPATHRNTNVLEVAPKHCRWLLCHYSIFPHFFLIFFSGGLLFFSAPPAPSIKKKEEFPFFFSTDTWNTPPPPSFSRFFVSCFSSSTSFFLVEVFLFATDRFLWLQRWEKDIRLPLPVSRIAVPLIVRLGVSVSVIETDSSKKKNSTKPGKTQ